MFKAQNGRQYNLAARTISKFLSEKGIKLNHTDALALSARLTGFASYEAACAAQEGPESGITREVRTWGDLCNALSALDEAQLGMAIQVTDGCDGNGNANFATAQQLLPACHHDIAAAGVVFPVNQPVLLISELQENMGEASDAPQGNPVDLILADFGQAIAAAQQMTPAEQIAAVRALQLGTWDAPNLHRDASQKLDLEEARRVAMQFEVATGESASVALVCIAQRGVADAIKFLNETHNIELSMGDYVIYSEKERGFFNNDFGWVHDKASASGFASDTPPLLYGVVDAEKVLYAEAVDVDPDAQDIADAAVTARFGDIKGAPVSKYSWPARYSTIWTKLDSPLLAAFGAVEKAVAERGYTGNLWMADSSEGRKARMDFHLRGAYVGSLEVLLRNAAMADSNARAAALYLEFESPFGGTSLLAEGSSPDTYYVTEARHILENLEWLNATKLPGIVMEQLARFS